MTPRIIFFGTPAFAVLVLEKLVEAGLTPVTVVTNPDRLAGRGRKLTPPPVKEYAEAHGIAVLQPEQLKDKEFLERMSALKPNVCVVASYGKILPKELLHIPHHGFINVHPSLLPAYRGPSPIQAAILNGNEETGATIMLMDEKMDHGPIIASTKYKIDSRKIRYAELHDALADLGGELLVQTLSKWMAGEITPREQDHAQATYTKLLTKEDGRIDWGKPATEIDSMVRALNPWPSTWTAISEIGSPKYSRDDKRVKILLGHATNEKTNLAPGTITKTKSGDLAVATGDGMFMVERVQVAGERQTSKVVLNDMPGLCFC